MKDWQSILEKSNQPEIVKLPDNLKQDMTMENWELYLGYPIPESSYISKDGFIHVGGEYDKLRISMIYPIFGRIPPLLSKSGG